MVWQLPLQLKLLDAKRLRSFVTRQGRLTLGQRQALEQLWPKHGIEVSSDVRLESVFPSLQDHVLEIGFGDGESLAKMAQNEPSVGFFGVEVHQPGVGALLNRIDEQELENVKVFYADARDVMTKFIPDNFLTRAQIFFPDPWPKKRHHKRRIIQKEFIDFISTKLKPGGVVHCATDWQPYAEHMLEVLKACDNLVNTSTSDDYVERPDHRPETKFERRGAKLGHGVWDLVFRKM